MKQFIGIEDLAGNALIELIQRNQERKVTFKQLNKYGTKVRQYLNKVTGEEVILLYNTNDVAAMAENYADFFKVENFGQENAYIELQENIDVTVLWKCFRSPFPIETMLAFMDDKVIEESELITA